MASDIGRLIFGEKSRVFTAKHVIVCISVLLLLSPVRAQSGSNGTQSNGSNQYPYAKFSPSMAIIIVILIAALFLMGFFSIYIRHCSNSTTGGSVRPLGGISASLRRRAASRGLDPVVIETFPTFVYSTVKGLKIGRGALECAVCLNEFEDDETLRLIPKCDHVFHPECIDAWLCSHVTCPVCRANLVPQPGETLQEPEFNPEDSDDRAETQNPQNDDVSIPAGEEHEEDALPPQVVDGNKSVNQNRPPRFRSIRPSFFEKFPRSHSTGHSLVNPGENTERFTLRLPEDVRKRMMTQALNRSTSVVIFSSEGSSRRGYRPGLGEGSSRGPRSFRRLDRGLKSDRWVFSMPRPFFARSSSSVRSPKLGEGSTSSRGTKTAVKLPSLKCLESKGNESGLISFDSARLPV